MTYIDIAIVTSTGKDLLVKFVYCTDLVEVHIFEM